MLIEEEETKGIGEINLDAVEAALAEVDISEEEDVDVYGGDDEEVDAVDLAFVEDEGHW